MNFNVSSYDSTYRSDIRDDIAQILQSDSSESLRRSSSSDYMDDYGGKGRMQSAIDKLISDSSPKINGRTSGAIESDSNPYCHHVVKSVSYNNPGTSEHVSYEIPTITHTVSDDTCRCDEKHTDSCPRNVTNIIQTQRFDITGAAGCDCYDLGERDIDDIINKYSSQEKDIDVPPTMSTVPSILPNKDATLDKKKLMQRINDLETEKLDGEKKLLDMKLEMLTLSKERDSLNDEFLSLQEQFLTHQFTDNDKTELEKRICDLDKMNSQVENELQSYKSDMICVRDEKENLQKRLLELEINLEEQKEKNDKLLRDKEKGRNRVEEANNWVAQLREWKTKAVADMEITKVNVTKFSELVKQNASHLQKVRSRNKKLRKKLKKATALMKEAKSRRQSMETEIRELKSQLERMKSEVEDKSSEVERSQVDLFETRDMNLALQKQLEDVAESKFHNTRQSNDIIESLEKELAEMKQRMENISEDNYQEILTLEKDIDAEKTMRNFMIISYKTLEEDYNVLYKSALDFRQVMTAVVQGTNFASGI